MDNTSEKVDKEHTGKDKYSVIQKDDHGGEAREDNPKDKYVKRYTRRVLQKETYTKKETQR